MIKLRMVIAGLVLLTGLSGCAGLPDMKLAQQAVWQGDLATAEKHFKQLAKLDYVQAQISLGDLYVQYNDNEHNKLAEHWYRVASVKSVRARNRLGKLLSRKDDASEADLLEAERLLLGAFESGDQTALAPLLMLYIENDHLRSGEDPQQLIQIARDEGLKEGDLAQIKWYRLNNTSDQHHDEIRNICEDLVDYYQNCYTELVYVYRASKEQEKLQALLREMPLRYKRQVIKAGTLSAVAKALTDSSYGQLMLDEARFLLELIAPNHPDAWGLLGRLAYHYPAFTDHDGLLFYLQKGRENGVAESEYLSGKLYFYGRVVPRNPWKAEEHLLNASAEYIAAHYMLGQIYKRGYLGRKEAEKALQHLLIAARAGQSAADLSIAELFSSGKGTRINRASAFAFAHLANQASEPKAKALLDELRASISANELAKAMTIVSREQRQRHSQGMEQIARVASSKDGL